MLERGLGPERPLLIASGNGVDHALMALAAQYVGVPVAPLAEQYSLIEAAHERLVHAVALLRPGMVFVDDAARFRLAMALPCLAGVELVAARPEGAGRPVTPLATLLASSGPVDAAAAAVGPQTLAKILLTSGSTATPKGVETTQQMLCVNQTQLADGFPFLRDEGHLVLDWLPWNHVFGGSHNFNMMLASGGSLYIDDGRPVAGRFKRTLENLALAPEPSLSFNVPLGYGMLLAALRADAALADRFLSAAAADVLRRRGAAAGNLGRLPGAGLGARAGADADLVLGHDRDRTLLHPLSCRHRPGRQCRGAGDRRRGAAAARCRWPLRVEGARART